VDWPLRECTQSIYIFDRASGQIAHRIAALPNVIHHLAFSPDGRHLAAALGGPNGIRVFSAASWKPVAADSDYQDSSYSVHFARDGRLVATSNDGQLRLYNPSFETIARRPIPGGNQPFFARFSPDGSRIAVGFNDSTNVSVVSANDLTLLHTADTTAVQGGDLSSVAWSADGRRLYAAGRNALPDGIVPIRFWDQRGQGPLQTLTLPTITRHRDGSAAPARWSPPVRFWGSGLGGAGWARQAPNRPGAADP
jgi:WD40 repeat protein